MVTDNLYNKSKLPITEELDFAYLLTLLRPIQGDPLFEWLPELFSIIGYESLIKLCKYCGGEVIKIPKLDDVVTAIDCLQDFYDVYIKHSREISDVSLDNLPVVMKVKDYYDATNN